MRTLLLCLLLGISGLITHAKSNALYPFRYGDRWGYIDGSGKEQIPALYRSAGKFSEGLAPVRLFGTYGYIDESGIVMIGYQFDYAEAFSGGIATAWLKGKPYLIDKKGEPLFQHAFIEIKASGYNRLWIVQSRAKKFGVVNQSGNLILDTIYARIDPFQFGKTVVHKEYPARGKAGKREDAAIVSAKGVIILPFGRFEDMGAVRDGYFAGRYNKDGAGDRKGKDVLIDPTGKPLFSINSEEWEMSLADFRTVGSPISINYRSRKGGGYSDGFFSGVVDNKGAVLFSDSTWDRVTPFAMNRAFVRYEAGHGGDLNHWKMIDGKGHQIGNRVFTDVYNIISPNQDEAWDVFRNSMAFVQTGYNKWGAIDTNGNYVIAPVDLDSATNSSRVSIVKRIGDILILHGRTVTKPGAVSDKYGFWDPGNRVLISPKYYSLQIDTDTDAPIRAMTDDLKLAYLNKAGKIIWKEHGPTPTAAPMDIDYMNRGYFYASGGDRADPTSYGGWGSSTNGAKTFKSQAPYKHNDLSIFISTTTAPWSDAFQGRKVYVMNDSHDTLYFPAQDSRLYMNVQAKDEDGSWKDIEYLPASWCGNSYHTVALSPKEYWDFVMPVYEGVLNTKLRVKLTYRYTSKLYEGNSNEVLYSNEVDGRINPAQLWRKREYHSGGLMDPYND